MFKEKWKAKGGKNLDETSAEFLEALANFDWNDCEECKKMEKQIQESHGIFEFDLFETVE